MKIFSAGIAELDGAFTASLALQLDLPCAPTDPNLVASFLAGEYSRIDSQLRLYEVFAGLPWPLMYKRMDHLFPDAAFLLVGPPTGREWLEDLVDGSQEYREEVQAAFAFDTLPGHEAELIDRYDEHIAAVRRWFADRPASLLTVSVTEPLAMDRVVDFLVDRGLQLPGVPQQARARQRARRA